MKIVQILKGQPFRTEFGIVGYSSVILIQSEGKNILFDCGQRGCALELKKGLKNCGLTPEEITDLVISHMHFDHVGNLPLFKNAVIHVGRAEWAQACQEPDEWDCQATVLWLRNRPLHLVEEGDQITGEVRVLELPGHTLGLIGLLCGKDTVLCSDAIKNRFELRQDIPLMTVDEEKSRNTIRRIRSMAREIYPGHDGKLILDDPAADGDLSFLLNFADQTVIRVAKP